MSVADQAGAAVREPQILHGGEEGLGLELDRLGEQAAGASPQHLGQGTVDLLRLTKPHDVGRAVHGVSLSTRGPGRLDTRLDTPPSSKPRHPFSRIALTRHSGFFDKYLGDGVLAHLLDGPAKAQAGAALAAALELTGRLDAWNRERDGLPPMHVTAALHAGAGPDRRVRRWAEGRVHSARPGDERPVANRAPC
jgi:hypothetical protein